MESRNLEPKDESFISSPVWRRGYGDWNEPSSPREAYLSGETPGRVGRQGWEVVLEQGSGAGFTEKPFFFNFQF